LPDPLSPDDIEQLRQLLQYFSTSGLSELIFKDQAGYTVGIKSPSQVLSWDREPHVFAGQSPSVGTDAQLRPASTPSGSEGIAAAQTLLPPTNTKALVAPMVGIFYQTPGPGEPPFVKPGDIIQDGQTFGLIEAMKVYSEIPADFGGRVVSIVVESGKLVQQGDPLVLLEAL
jgi:acetyl-CoA carboxylase biotin carboxyl carrier protein